MKPRLAARGVALALSALACSRESAPAPRAPSQPGQVTADDIPIAHTPPGGYGQSFPAPVLATCTEPLVAGAPDLRGVWRTLHAERDGKPVPEGSFITTYAERIEQCGNRIVDMGGGTIADARADGTLERGVHDVLVFDYKTPIHVVASYEDGVFVLRAALFFGITLRRIQVTRRLDEDGHMVWTRPDQGHLVVTLERIGGPNDGYTRVSTLPPDGGPRPGEAFWRYRLRALWAFFTA